MIVLTDEDIHNLINLVELIQSKIGENSSLERKLNLRKKFIGDLGEAIGLIKLYEKYGNSYTYNWDEKKKGFDLKLIKNNESMTFQIKTSSKKDYYFSILTLKDIRDDTVDDIKNHKFEAINERIVEGIEDKRADYWLLIHLNENERTFYLLDKESVKTLIKSDYSRHILKGSSTAIKNGAITFRIKKREENDEFLKANNKL